MAKDFTKYNVEGLGKNLNKRNLVFTIVKDWVEKNNPSFEDMQRTFPDEIQGSKGFIRLESEVKTEKHFNIRQPLKIKNGIVAVVSNQWGKNCKGFIELAQSLGYKIQPQSTPDNLEEGNSSNSNNSSDTTNVVGLKIEFDNNFPRSFVQTLKENRKNETNLDIIDNFIESGLSVSHLYYGAGKIFETLSSRGHANRDEDFVLSFEYSKEDYDVAFSLSEDASELKEKLQSQNLIDIILEYEAIENIESLDFKLYYPAYLYSVINRLSEMEDPEMIAEFIASQSLGYSRFVEDSGYEYGSDWILELCDELIAVLYGIDCSSDDYKNDVTLSGQYFGISMDSSVDYLKIAEEITAQII